MLRAIRIDLSGVAYRDNQWWVAHCLQMDVVAEGDTAEEALQDLIALCDLKIEDALQEGDLRSIFRSAPPEIWELYAKATKKRVSVKHSDHISRFDPRAVAV